MKSLLSTIFVLALMAVEKSVCMPTGTTETNPTTPCAWQSDIAVSSLTSLLRQLKFTKVKAELAFNSTCALVAGNSMAMYSLLEQSASEEESYPAFSQQAGNSCNVQELVRATYNVTYECLRLTRQFLEDIENYYTTRRQATLDIIMLKNNLQSVNTTLFEMVPGMERPSAMSSLRTGGDSYTDRSMNVRLLARIALELQDIISSFSEAIDDLNN